MACTQISNSLVILCGHAWRALGSGGQPPEARPARRECLMRRRIGCNTLQVGLQPAQHVGQQRAQLLPQRLDQPREQVARARRHRLARSPTRQIRKLCTSCTHLSDVCFAQSLKRAVITVTYSPELPMPSMQAPACQTNASFGTDYLLYDTVHSLRHFV